MKTIYINGAELKAVALFAGKQDVRYYLNGVLVQATARVTRIVATDGAILGICDSDQENTGASKEEFIIPVETLAALKIDPRAPVRVTITGQRHTIEQAPNEPIEFKPVDGKFPQYQRVIPDSVSGENTHFSGAYLVAIHKAQQLISKANSARIWHNGTSEALFRLTGNSRFIGVVMPLKFNKGKDASEPIPITSPFRNELEAEEAGVELEGADLL